MDFTYTIKKQQLKKYLTERHRNVHLICIFFFIVLFVIMNFKFYMDNKLLMSIALFIILIILYLLVWGINKIFNYVWTQTIEKEGTTLGRHHVIVDKTHIEDTIHHNTISFLWDDICDVKMSKKVITVKKKGGQINLVFYRNFLGDDKFNNLQKEINKYFKK